MRKLIYSIVITSLLVMANEVQASTYDHTIEVMLPQGRMRDFKVNKTANGLMLKKRIFEESQIPVDQQMLLDTDGPVARILSDSELLEFVNNVTAIDLRTDQQEN